MLVLSHVDADGDAIGSMLALTAALEKLKKETTAAIDGTIPAPFRFLPRVDTIVSRVSAGQEFTISLDTS